MGESVVRGEFGVKGRSVLVGNSTAAPAHDATPVKTPTANMRKLFLIAFCSPRDGRFMPPRRPEHCEGHVRPPPVPAHRPLPGEIFPRAGSNQIAIYRSRRHAPAADSVH